MTDEQLDHTPMDRGKYGPQGQNKTPSEVADIDPRYLAWAYEKWTPAPCSQLLYRACADDIADADRQSGVSADQARFG